MVTVLAADDDPDILELVRMVLERSGLRCLTAHDGLDALETLSDEPVDLAVLDIQMPGLSGLAVVAAIRAITAVPRFPIVMLTAMSSPDDVQRGRDLGADAYLTKPFSPKTLVQTVHDLLVTRRG